MDMMFRITFRFDVHSNNGLHRQEHIVCGGGGFNDMWEAHKKALTELSRQHDIGDYSQIGEIESVVEFPLSGIKPMVADLRPELVKIRKKLRGERNESSRQS